jgi:dihydroorotase-like cyclic amidohydrolase
MSTMLMGGIVLPDRILQGTIFISEGKIERIEEGFSNANEGQVWDYRGKYLLPGTRPYARTRIGV